MQSAICYTTGKTAGLRQEERMALGFPSFTKEVIMMTDFEMLSIVIMINMLVIAALSFMKQK